MTSKLTITDERLSELVAFKPLPGTDINSATRDEWMAMAAELHERRKSDSEPVAYMWDSKRNDIDAPGFYFPEHLFFAESNVKQWGGEVIPLYRHAQPAPVVPDAYVRDERGRMMLNGVCEPKIGFGIGWNACRAAMLAAAPHDTTALNSVQSVVTVPGKWIPVSERMPEDRTQVILWDAEIGEVTSGHYSHKTQTFYHCGDAIENEITHWMPTPAAPQEVKP